MVAPFSAIVAFLQTEHYCEIMPYAFLSSANGIDVLMKKVIFLLLTTKYARRIRVHFNMFFNEESSIVTEQSIKTCFKRLTRGFQFRNERW